MFQIVHRHLFWFTGLTCDELSAKVPRTNQHSKCKIGNTKKKEKEKRKKKSPFHGSAPSARVMSMNAVYLNSIAVSTFRSEIVTVPFRFWLLYLLFSRRKWTMSRQDSTTTFLNETASELTLANFLSELTCTYA